MHGKVGRQRKALSKRHPSGQIKHTRSEDRELRRSPAFQRRVIDIVTEAVALVRNPDTGSQIGLALLRFDRRGSSVLVAGPAKLACPPEAKPFLKRANLGAKRSPT